MGFHREEDQIMKDTLCLEETVPSKVMSIYIYFTTGYIFSSYFLTIFSTSTISRGKKEIYSSRSKV